MLNNIEDRYKERHTNKEKEIRDVWSKVKFFFTEIAKIKIFDADHSTALVDETYFE